MMDDLIVTKSNRLIEASYRLSMYEQQIILLAIVQARESGLDPWQLSQKPVVIRVQDFMKAYNITDTSGNVYRYLRDAIKTLFDRSVTVYHNLEDTQNPAVTEMRWIWKRTYSDDLGYLSFTLAPDVIPYITRLEKEFTSYDLKQIGNFTNSYAVRLFELLKQYQTVGKREIKLETLRTILQLEDKYSAYGELMRNVVLPSIKQINQHTDFKVDFESYKLGRKVISLKFIIKTKKIKEPKARQVSMRLKTEQPIKTDAVIKAEKTFEQGRLPTQADIDALLKQTSKVEKKSLNSINN
jgi:plasmid replication initiation protein